MFHRMMNYGELDPKPSVALTKDLIKKSLPKYKRHDDLIIVQEASWEEFKKSLPIPVVKEDNSPFSIDEDELASLVCQTIQKPPCRRLAVEKGVKRDDFRSPDIELILGDNGIVNHKENHIIYRFDITKCMFSFGNINEKMRMADLDCKNEIVVDLFAGIGYFTLPILIHAKAKHLYACEWNPNAVEALKKNLTINKVESSRYTIIEGDNRSNRPTDVAQRVILGILPSCLNWMQTAFECIDKSTGAILHCHDLVESKPPSLGDKQTSMNSLEASSTSKPPSLSYSIFNQSLSSSSSSHSTIEKLTAIPDDKTQSSESDKDTSSPVFLEKPTGSCTNVFNSSSEPNSNTNETSSGSSHHEDSIHEPPFIDDNEQSLYDARGQALIAKIKDEVDAHDLKASLINIQAVKSYAPHVNHVVFDIKIVPKSNTSNDFYVSPIFHQSDHIPNFQ